MLNSPWELGETEYKHPTECENFCSNFWDRGVVEYSQIEIEGIEEIFINDVQQSEDFGLIISQLQHTVKTVLSLTRRVILIEAELESFQLQCCGSASGQWAFGQVQTRKC